MLHARLRKGSSQRGAKRFCEELIARVRRAGASGPLVVRADSGFFSYALIDTLVRLKVAFSITVSINAQVRACIEAIDESAWQPITYPDGGAADVAETTYVTGPRRAGVPYDWSCAGPASPTAASKPCGPTGATMPSSQTSTPMCSPPTPSTGTTPPSSWPSVT